MCVHAAPAPHAERRIGRVGESDSHARHGVAARPSSADDIA